MADNLPWTMFCPGCGEGQNVFYPDGDDFIGWNYSYARDRLMQFHKEMITEKIITSSRYIKTHVEHYCNDNVGFYLQGKRTISIAKFTLTRLVCVSMYIYEISILLRSARGVPTSQANP